MNSNDQKKKTFHIEANTKKLEAGILFFIHKIPNKLDRIKLCKHLYYTEGHYFQKFSQSLFDLPFLHIEGSPQPIYFNEIINKMIQAKTISVIPNVVTENKDNSLITVLKGFGYKLLIDYQFANTSIFTKVEKRVLSSVASLLNGDLSLETRYFPNLYQEYTQTGLYEEINSFKFATGKRPHLSWKAWANKIFKLRWQ